MLTVFAYEVIQERQRELLRGAEQHRLTHAYQPGAGKSGRSLGQMLRSILGGRRDSDIGEPKASAPPTVRTGQVPV